VLPPSGSLRLRFVFQANKNNNAFPGWFVDDVAIGGGNSAPVVTWQDPANGEAVWGGSIPVSFSAGDEDADGTLAVGWLVNGEPMSSPPSYDDASGRYRGDWITAGLSDGWYTFEARATDSGGSVGRALIDVWFDSVNDPPQVFWSSPSDGATVAKGSVPVRVSAPDDRHLPADVGVEWFVDGVSQGALPYDAEAGFHQAIWDASGLAEGAHTLRAVATDGDGASAAHEITVQLIDAALHQDFEQSFDGWTTSGLWSIQESLACGSGATYASAARAAYYGNPSTCQYHTGSRNSGLLVSPSFDVGGPATLNFAYRRQVESSSKFRDVTFVETSYDDGGSWQRVWERSARNPSSSDWETAVVPLETSGATVRVRFGFDTMDKDNNRFLGWIVDDVLIVED
ncbi:MAG: Ig-like domain-containing protein, partial [Candidatus Binatia bacterium]